MPRYPALPRRRRPRFLPGTTILAGLLAMAACASPADRDADAADDAVLPPVDAADATDAETPSAPDAATPCTVLFGVPNEHTGLTADQCRPECRCEGKDFVPPAYTADRIAGIAAMVLAEPTTPLAEDPYARPEAHVPFDDAVCGVLLDTGVAGTYRLATFASVDAARTAGAHVTHQGACGLCSPLVDLAVYMRQPDLTGPVRECGLAGMIQGDDELMQCLRDLGFDENCARTWFYNTKHTQAKCQDVCMAALDQPYHLPDGTLNACLVCDEVESGPVFKAVAGRTRRNTGLPSSMCRPCSEVLPIVHDYR